MQVRPAGQAGYPISLVASLDTVPAEHLKTKSTLKKSVTHTQCSVAGARSTSGIGALVQKQRIGQLKPHLGSRGISRKQYCVDAAVKKQRIGQLKPYLGSQSLSRMH